MTSDEYDNDVPVDLISYHIPPSCHLDIHVLSNIYHTYPIPISLFQFLSLSTPVPLFPCHPPSASYFPPSAPFSPLFTVNLVRRAANNSSLCSNIFPSNFSHLLTSLGCCVFSKLVPALCLFFYNLNVNV